MLILNNSSETATNRELTFAWDLWSLGCLTICLLMGYPQSYSRAMKTLTRRPLKPSPGSRQSSDIYQDTGNNHELKLSGLSLSEFLVSLGLPDEVQDWISRLLKPVRPLSISF